MTSVIKRGPVDYFQGVYPSLAALQLAVPVGKPGDYAIVDPGPGVDATQYIWDNTDSDWVPGSVINPNAMLLPAVQTSTATKSFDSLNTDPSIRIVPDATFPTSSLAAGALHTHTDGLLYQYDSTRSKWLCVSREPLSWTDNGNNDSNYLREGNIISTTSGWPVPFDCTIVQIIANGENNLTKGFELRSNSGGAFASIQAFSLSAGFFNDETLNIDVDQGDQLKCFVTAAGAPVNDPRVTVYIRKRGV